MEHMRNKRLKEIDQKLDTLLDYVVAIQTLLIRQNPIPHKTLREQAEDDHLFDPTKYPEVGESDPITVSEADKHFDN